MTHNLPVGLLRSYVNIGNTCLVGPEMVDFADFMSQEAIGTNLLFDNSAVVIVSPRGCIMAQVTMQPVVAADDPFGAENYVNMLMEDVQVFYQTFRPKLAGASAYIICAKAQGEISSPQLVQVMQACFRGMGLEPSIVTYDFPPRIGRPAAATVIVIGPNRQGGPAGVYLEDNRLN